MAKQTLQTNGEKTSPAPLEAIFRNDAQIAEALVFGSNRATCGAAIIPRSGSLMVEDLSQTLSRVNKAAPAHSQIPFELLIILSNTTTLPRASKGSLQRGRAYEMLKREIQQAYVDFETRLNPTGPTHEQHDLSGTKLLDYISKSVRQSLGSKVRQHINPADDLFGLGLNSLQSVRVRNVLQSVRKTKRERSMLTHNLLRRISI